MQQRTLELTPAQRTELEQTRDGDRRPYLRECAAALVKVADGMPAYLVARRGLHKPRHPDTIYRWLDKYEADGLAGLIHKPRGHRGFPPSEPVRPLVHPPAGAHRVRHPPDALALG
jgi:hypothetical protein